MAFGVPSLLNLPMRGPRIMASASAAHPPVACTTPEPAKSTAPWPEVQRRAEVGEPAAAPHPHAVDRVDDRAHRDLGEEEAGERDPLGDGADDDVAGRLHEHDLEQEQRHHADVVGRAALQEEAVQCR